MVLPSVTCVSAGHVSAAAAEDEDELVCPPASVSEDTQRRSEWRQPAAAAAAAAADGCHDGQRPGARHAPRSAHGAAGPRGPAPHTVITATHAGKPSL